MTSNKKSYLSKALQLNSKKDGQLIPRIVVVAEMLLAILLLAFTLLPAPSPQSFGEYLVDSIPLTGVVLASIKAISLLFSFFFFVGLWQSPLKAHVPSIAFVCYYFLLPPLVLHLISEQWPLASVDFAVLSICYFIMCGSARDSSLYAEC